MNIFVFLFVYRITCNRLRLLRVLREDLSGRFGPVKTCYVRVQYNMSWRDELYATGAAYRSRLSDVPGVDL